MTIEVSPIIFISAVEPIAVSIEEACERMLPGLRPWNLHEAIRTGALKAKIAGRTYLVTPRALRQWYDGLEDADPVKQRAKFRPGRNDTTP